MAPKRRQEVLGLDALLAAREMVVICGSGGVGKTTVAATLGAMAATELGGRVLVLTVDPARRLANALGLDAFGNVERQVPAEAFAGAGVTPRGSLWAAMLDMRAGWDELIERHAPDDVTREAVLSNPLYQNVTGRFVHSHDYLAMERLYDVHASGRYDLVIVDTPPSRNALDVLDAPGRMMEFFGSRLLRWLTVPYRSRLFTVASKPFYQVADRVLGSRFLEDIAEFFVLLQQLEPGFVARAKQVERLLSDPRTTFLVVSTLESAAVQEAQFFAEALGERNLHLGGLVMNRTLPPQLAKPSTAKAATKLRQVADDAGLVEEVADLAGADADLVRGVLTEVADRFADTAVVARREAERRAELEGIAPLTVAVPALDVDVTDLGALLRLGRHLWT